MQIITLAKTYFLIILLIAAHNVHATKNAFWTKQNKDTSFVYTVDQEGLSNYLSSDSSFYHLLIPLKDTLEVFEFKNSGVLNKALSEKYPQIKSLSGENLNGQKANLVINKKGVFLMILDGNNTTYINATNEELNPNTARPSFPERIKHKPSNASNSQLRLALNSSYPSGDRLRKYRIAVGATGEYTAFHGGTKEDALSAIVTTLSRVNEIYNRDLSIQLELIADNDKIVFTDGDTDPFNNTNADILIDQAQSVLDGRIGTANYDVGHIFSTGAGGSAILEVVCEEDYKAQGVTGNNYPIGDAFNVDYVAHELGHQFGAEHTFNGNVGSCNGNATVQAYEPGSGSTIMAYAGICGVQNIQNNSSPYFHVSSIEMIHNFITQGRGRTCAILEEQDNEQPLVQSNAPHLTLPINTPFELIAEGSDPDGDVLTYCWEEYDLGPSGSPTAPVDNAPLFRSFEPSFSARRIFPQLSDLLYNTSTIGELLPSYARQLDFKVTVRDGKGGVNSDFVEFDVSEDAGPFVVLETNLPDTLLALSSFTVEWEVANTDNAPINCSTVEILLSQDGGFTFTDTLLRNTPNDGSAVVTIPLIESDQVRLKVKAKGNVFFDVNDKNLVIDTGSEPQFFITASDTPLYVCDQSRIDTFYINIIGVNNYSDDIRLSLGADSLNEFQVLYLMDSTVQVNNTVAVIYLLSENIDEAFITIKAFDGSVQKSFNARVKLRAQNQPLFFTSPLAFQGMVLDQPTFSWTEIEHDLPYTFTLSEDLLQNEVVFRQQTYDTLLAGFAILIKGELYFMEVQTTDACGEVHSTGVVPFAIKGDNCRLYNSTNSPTNIVGRDPNQNVVVESRIVVEEDFELSDINLYNISGAHTYVEDLWFDLISPSNNTYELIGEVCGDQNNFNFNVDDDYGLGTISCPLTQNLTYKANDDLSLLHGTSSKGNWTIRLTDIYPSEDNGRFDAWQLELCEDVVSNSPPFLSRIDTLYANFGSYSPVSASSLQVNDDASPNYDIRYTVLTLPDKGQLFLNNDLLTVGSQFTQYDIDNDFVLFLATEEEYTVDGFQLLVDDGRGAILEDTIVVQVRLNDVLSSVDYTFNDVRIFPNPSDGAVTVVGLNGTCSVYSIYGQILITKILNKTGTSVDIENFPPGYYLFKISDKDGDMKSYKVLRE